MKARRIAEKDQQFQLDHCHAELRDKQVWKNFMAKKNGVNSSVDNTTIRNHATRPTTTDNKIIPSKRRKSGTVSSIEKVRALVHAVQEAFWEIEIQKLDNQQKVDLDNALRVLDETKQQNFDNEILSVDTSSIDCPIRKKYYKLMQAKIEMEYREKAEGIDPELLKACQE